MKSLFFWWADRSATKVTYYNLIVLITLLYLYRTTKKRRKGFLKHIRNKIKQEDYNSFLDHFDKLEQNFYLKKGTLDLYIKRIHDNSPQNVITADKLEKACAQLKIPYENLNYIYETSYFIVGEKSKTKILDMLNSNKIWLFSWLYSRDELSKRWETLSKKLL